LLDRLAPLAPVGGAESIVARQAPDLFALWLAWEAECGARRDPPFWAVVWPASRVLARYLLAHPQAVSGQTVLDLGCGGAAAGIAAATAGAAMVIANDVDPAAVFVASLNARANRVALTLSEGDLTGTPPQAATAVILAADLFYEREPARGMLGWLRACAAHGSRVLVADGGRPFSPSVRLVDLHREIVSVCTDVEGAGERTVRVCELLP
jgi:predicted nicotinamide N-methyase